MFHLQFPHWLLFGLPLVSLSLSVGCGIALVFRNREDETFLPPAQYMSYFVSAFGWSWFLSATANDLFDARLAALWIAVVLPWFLFLGPWLAFRRQHPTPLVVDAAIVTLATTLGFGAATSVRFLPSVRWLARDGYVAMIVTIGIVAIALQGLKKAGIPLCAAAACAAAVFVAAAPLLPILSH